MWEKLEGFKIELNSGKEKNSLSIDMHPHGLITYRTTGACYQSKCMHMQEMHLVYMEKCKKCMPYVRRKIRLCIRIRMCMYRSVTEELIYYIRIYIYIYIRGGPRARGRPVRTVVRNMASTLMLKAVPSETHVSTGTNCPYVSMYIIIIRLNGSILSIKNNNYT